MFPSGKLLASMVDRTLMMTQVGWTDFDAIRRDDARRDAFLSNMTILRYTVTGWKMMGMCGESTG
jgi:hypothetical protein